MLLPPLAMVPGVVVVAVAELGVALCHCVAAAGDSDAGGGPPLAGLLLNPVWGRVMTSPGLWRGW